MISNLIFLVFWGLVAGDKTVITNVKRQLKIILASDKTIRDLIRKVKSVVYEQ